MKKLFSKIFLILKLGVAVFALYLLGQYPGTVEVSWFGYSVTIAIGAFSVAFLGLIFLIWGIIRFWEGMRAFPQALQAFFKRRRQKKAQEALVEGMVALSSGEFDLAKQLVDYSQKLNPNQLIPQILQAQAIYAAGHYEEAEQAFKGLLAYPETAFLGIRGLILLSMRRGDHQKLHEYLQQGMALRPNSPWILKQLISFHIKDQTYQKAELLVETLHLTGGLTKEQVNRQQAILFWLRAEQALIQSNRSEFFKLAHRSLKLDPHLVGVSIALAKEYAKEGRVSEVKKVVFEGFSKEPNASLGYVWIDVLSHKSDIEKYRLVEELTSKTPLHSESLYLLASVALSAKLWGQARRHLKDLLIQEASQRVYRLMIYLEEQEKPHSQEDSKEWIQKAFSAPDIPQWTCGSCHHHAPTWVAVCPACGNFDGFEWRGKCSTPLRTQALIEA